MTTAQNTPCAIAEAMRMAKAKPYDGARAVASVASANTPRDTPTTRRRSTRDTVFASGMLVTMTVSAQIEMSRPICIGETPRSADISGMSPAGSDSAVTVTSTPRLRMRRERSGRRAGADVAADAGGSATDAVDVVMHRG